MNGKPNGNGNGNGAGHAKAKVDPAPRALKMVTAVATPVRARRKPAARA
ncbi:hypothetical protein [Sandarakinorhabdus rubra]|nr:hypothetical protein [Sandarakinorhabdus rubra]